MKIAFITHYSKLYGANRSLLNLLDGLLSYGVSPLVIAPQEGDLNVALRKRGVPCIVYPFHSWSRVKTVSAAKWYSEALCRLWENIKIVHKIVKELEPLEINLIYSNSSVISLGAMLAFRMKKKHVWRLREFGDLDYGLSFDWGKNLSRLFIKKADLQICVSQAVNKHFFRSKIPSSCHVVYNGVANIATMKKVQREKVVPKWNKKKFTFAIVGLLHPSKGQETAIKALNLLKESQPQIRLILAGDGDNRLEDLVSELDLVGHVQFLGYVEDPFVVYQGCDAVLMCSRNEAMGRVTVEAMASGKPVIGFNSAGTAELIDHGVNGLLYNGDEHELARCMQNLAENPLWAQEMGGNALNIAKEKYSIELCTDKIMRLLSQCNK